MKKEEIINDVKKHKVYKLIEDELLVFKQLFTKITDGVLITDSNAKILWSNKAACEITGYTNEELNERDLSLFSNGHDNKMLRKIKEDLDSNGKYDGRIWHVKKSGERRLHKINIFLLDTKMNERKYGVILKDITLSNRRQKKIEFLAFRDRLTHTYNRTFLWEKLRYELKDYRNCAVFYLDIDDFKMINDNFGHPIGDKVIKKVGKRLVRNLRKGDYVIRIGGDEFIIVVSNLRDLKSYYSIARKLINIFNTPIDIDGMSLNISLSVGIALSEGEETLENLIKNADIALYEAKRRGKNKFNLFDDSLMMKIKEEYIIDNELRKMINNNNFKLLFQPIIDISTNMIVGAEALIRSKSEILNKYSIERHIEVAEKYRTIIPIGYLIFNELSSIIKHINEKIDSEIFINMNVSIKQLEDKRFVEKIKTIINDTDIKPNIGVEITETINIHDDNIEVIDKNLVSLKELGIKISIDDFGTGYSSIKRLYKLPIDKIKIDKYFIDNLTFNNNTEVLKHMINMFNIMNIKTIAEGVETKEQLDILKSINCNMVQGYYYCKPIELEEFIKLLKKQVK